MTINERITAAIARIEAAAAIALEAEGPIRWAGDATGHAQDALGATRTGLEKVRKIGTALKTADAATKTKLTAVAAQIAKDAEATATRTEQAAEQAKLRAAVK